MARLDLPDKFRDEDSTERRWWTRRRKKRSGRRSFDGPFANVKASGGSFRGVKKED